MNEETRKKIEDICRENAIELYHAHPIEHERQQLIDEYAGYLIKGAGIGYNLASEELKRKDEQLTDCGKKYFELKSLLQSREDLLKEIRKGGWDHIEIGKRIDDLLAQSEKL